MSTPLREAALAAIAARLTAELPDVTFERARRAPVNINPDPDDGTDPDALPLLILRGEGWAADLRQEPGLTHYTCGFSVAGTIAADSDLGAEQALSALQARIVAALSGWTPDTLGLGDIMEQDSEFLIYDAEDSVRPAGEFVTRFELLAIAATGAPYVA